MPKRILIVVLDWGLGHATRCIPLIESLLSAGHQLAIGSAGPALTLLRAEFPNLDYFRLPAYKIRYPTDSMVLNMVWQLPKILYVIYRERRVVQQLIRDKEIEVIIADHRYGCFSKAARSIFICHQIHLLIPLPLVGKVANFFHRLFIKQYDACWIPDFAESPNLSGKLSHPPGLPHAYFIGPLSRFRPMKIEKKYDLIVVLSGPEPQRSLLEMKILEQLPIRPLKVLIVRGNLNARPLDKDWGNLAEIVDFLHSGELNAALAASVVVVCRSGYSSIMDLAALGKKAILIPTPGQTEQAYLARYLYERRICYYQEQGSLDLEVALEEVRHFSGFSGKDGREGRFEEIIEAW